MKLFGSLGSPYVRKVRIVMAEKKFDYEFAVTDVWDVKSAFMAVNPLGKVPCLIMEGGEALFDSPVIVEYLDGLSPVGKLIPTQGRERAEIKTWEALADGLLDAAILARNEATWEGRSNTQRSQAWIERQLEKVHSALKAMSQGLSDRAYCKGAQISLADIAIGCALGYLEFRFSQLEWRETYPNLGVHLDKLTLRQSFIDTQPR